MPVKMSVISREATVIGWRRAFMALYPKYRVCLSNLLYWAYMGLMLLVYPTLFLSLFFEVFLLLSFLEGKRARPVPALRTGILPTVTIFVPCYNEERTVAK